MTTDRDRILVVGAGYVGLVTAVGMASLGRDVAIVESDPRRHALLERGVVPIHEAGLQAGFEQGRERGTLRMVAPEDATWDIVFVCVGTPIDDRGRADLSQLEAALVSLSPAIESGAIVVIRSTMPLGSTRPIIDRLKLPHARTLSNPEFLRQGSAMVDFMAPSRIVIGTFSDVSGSALAKVQALFETMDAPVLVVGIEDAEVLKNAANAFLALKLSFTNEVAALCEQYGADVDLVLDGIGRDPRIGRQYMRPSFGFGGSCLPKELQTLALAGLERGLEMHVTSAAAEANLAHQDRFVQRIERLMGGSVRGQTVGLLGLAFKAGTDDVRSSPALRVARRLLERGAQVRGFDPEAAANAKEALPSLSVVDSPTDLVRDADLVAITTEWPQFVELDWPTLIAGMRRPIVVDGRRLLDGWTIARSGAIYERVGSPDGAYARDGVA